MVLKNSVARCQANATTAETDEYRLNDLVLSVTSVIALYAIGRLNIRMT